MEENYISIGQKLEKHLKILLSVVLMSTAFRSMGMSIVQIGLPSFVESVAQRKSLAQTIPTGCA